MGSGGVELSAMQTCKTPGVQHRSTRMEWGQVQASQVALDIGGLPTPSG